MTRRRNLADWEREHIVMAYRNGEKVAAIAVEFRVSEATVNNIRRAAGVPARTIWTRRRARTAVLEASQE